MMGVGKGRLPYLCVSSEMRVAEGRAQIEADSREQLTLALLKRLTRERVLRHVDKVVDQRGRALLNG